MTPYRTLGRAAQAEFIEKKSRFIGQGTPAPTEADALGFLAQIRKAHREASHNAYAYIIGQNAGIQRYSDDGEPGGTAGLPILEVLKARGAVDCCVVATRYYGGVQLGAAGLGRAYAKACVLAVDACALLTMEPTQRYWLGVSYPQWDKTLYLLRRCPCQVEGTEFATTVTATLRIRAADAADVLARVQTATDGQAETLLLEEGYEAWEQRPD
jgi:uncharacterized YigZ family protein